MSIQKCSWLNVVDNSGGFWVKCISVFGNKKLGRVGDLLLVVLKIYVNTKKVKKGIKYIGLLINVSTWQNRLNGVYFKMFDNRVILFNREFKQLSSRVYGICSKDIYLNLNGSHKK